MKYEFIESGSLVSPRKNTVYLDVGNDLCHGIIDHHQSFEKGCAAQLVLKHKDYLTNWITDAANATIVLHIWPDFDCVASAYITEKILSGEDKINRNKLQLLADLAYQIDQALDLEQINVNDPSLYIIFELSKELILNDRSIPFQQKNMAIVQKGFEIFDHLMAHMKNDAPQIPGGLFAQTEQFAEQKQILAEEVRKYLSDRQDKEKFREIEIELPLAKTREKKKVAGVIYRDPTCSLFKLLIRKGIESAELNLPRYVFSMVIFSKSEYQKYESIILSVDPDLPVDEQVDLLGLGAVLNQKEEEKFLIENLDPVTEKGPRFTEYNLSDPWYDGRGHHWTIVASPHFGTKLSNLEIEHILHNFTKTYSYYANASSRCELIFKLAADKHLLSELSNWDDAKVEKSTLTQAFHNFLECCDKKLIRIQQKDNCRVFIYNQKIVLLFVEMNYDASQSSLSELFTENNNFNDNLKLETILPTEDFTFLQDYQPQLIYKNWWLALKSTNDINTKDDLLQFKRIAKNFSDNSITPFKTNFEELKEDETVNLSRYSHCIIKPGGIYFILRSNDPDLEYADRNYYFNLWQKVVPYLVFNGLMLFTSLNFITESITEINYQEQKTRRTIRKLNNLKDFLINLKTRSIQFNLTTHIVLNEIWEKLHEKLKINIISENVDNSITELGDYLQTKRQSIIDHTVFILSLIIIPFSLIADYFGGLLSDHFGSWTKFVYVVITVYAIAVVFTFIIYRIIHRMRKKE